MRDPEVSRDLLSLEDELLQLISANTELKEERAMAMTRLTRSIFTLFRTKISNQESRLIDAAPLEYFDKMQKLVDALTNFVLNINQPEFDQDI